MSDHPGALEVNGSDDLVAGDDFALDQYSIVLSMPRTANSDSAIRDVMKSQYSETEYAIIPLTDWRAYEQVFQIVIQNLRRKHVTGIVLNHDTGEVVYLLGDKATHEFIRLVQLRKPEVEGTVTAWAHLSSDE